MGLHNSVDNTANRDLIFYIIQGKYSQPKGGSQCNLESRHFHSCFITTPMMASFSKFLVSWELLVGLPLDALCLGNL